MSTVLPPIGTRGIYAFIPPFDQYCDTGVEYTCQGLRRISEYIASNEDVKALVYTKYGIEQSYDEAVEKDYTIVSLQSRKGHWLYVPENYISNHPSGDGVQYRTVMLTCALPSIPVSTDLSNVMIDVASLVKTSLGVDAKINYVETSRIVLVSQAKHIETATRRSIAATRPNNHSEVLRLTQKVAQLQSTILELENYIRNHTT